MIDVIEAIQTGDAVAIQGQLQVELAPGKKGKSATVAGIFITATEVLRLRKRSINALGLVARQLDLSEVTGSSKGVPARFVI